MDSLAAALAASVGTVAFFGCIAYCTWLDYRKKKDERDAEHAARLKALELGYAPQDAEIARAKADASAAWAAGVIGLVVPVVTMVLTFVLTLIAVLNRQPGESLSVGALAIGWGIAGVVSIVAIQGALHAIRGRTRKDAGAATRRERVLEAASGEFQEKRDRL
jgi:hypothetical protein